MFPPDEELIKYGWDEDVWYRMLPGNIAFSQAHDSIAGYAIAPLGFLVRLSISQPTASIVPRRQPLKCACLLAAEARSRMGQASCGIGGRLRTTDQSEFHRRYCDFNFCMISERVHYRILQAQKATGDTSMLNGTLYQVTKRTMSQ